MLLELTDVQVAGLAQSDARNFVEQVHADLLLQNPRLAGDPALLGRLWTAYQGARNLGLEQDENLVGFLRLEAYMSGFYLRPATHAWLSRPGHSGDERFEDYWRVTAWQQRRPLNTTGEQTHGGFPPSGSGSGSSRGRPSLFNIWSRLVGRDSSGGNC